MDGKNDSVSPESFWTLNQRVADDRRRAFVKGISWSGNERNFFFVGGLPGNQFADLSAVSGLDDPADGRGFSLLDFDRDGWPDIILAAANMVRPQFFYYRNNGDGSFTEITEEAMPQTWLPQGLDDVVKGDFNGDGWTDLVGFGVGNMCIAALFTNQGDGTFVQTFPFDLFCGQYAATDANQDGRTDLFWVSDVGPRLLLSR